MTAKPMWKEGLFIMPQHLQLFDAYHEQLLDARLKALSPYQWGVSELEIDRDELARGVFRLSRCTAVMPDGALVRIDRDQQIQGLALTVAGESKGRRALEVYLGVPSAAVGGVATDSRTAGARYARAVETMPDVYGDAADTEIECVRPHAQLLLGDDNRQNYVTIKLAELVGSEGGRMAVSNDYLPPALRVGAAAPLMERLDRLVASLAAKQRDLVAKYGGRAAAMVEFGAADMSSFWYLHTVNTALPRLMHFGGGDVHPEVLYLALAELAGQLSTFESSSDPVDLPRFEHARLAQTLYPLFDRILRLLGTVVSARYTAIPLDQTQPGLFVGRIDDPQLLRKNNLYLVAGGDIPEESLRDDVPRFVKVGSVDQIAQIVQSALPGVGLRIDMAPPSAIPVRAHMVYMRLAQEGQYWSNVLQSQTVAIYQPVKPERVKLELLAVQV